MKQSDIPADQFKFVLNELQEGSYGTVVGKVVWDEEKEKFLVKDTFFGTVQYFTDEEVLRAYAAALRKKEEREYKSTRLVIYGDAVRYFYGEKVRFDNRGEFIVVHGFLKREYLTPAQLDDILERYEEVLDKKKKRKKK